MKRDAKRRFRNFLLRQCVFNRQYEGYLGQIGKVEFPGIVKR
jgi:hypothetical protein